MALSKSGRKLQPDDLAAKILSLQRQGYTEVPGYTVAEVESTGDVYIAIQMRPPPPRPVRAKRAWKFWIK